MRGKKDRAVGNLYTQVNIVNIIETYPKYITVYAREKFVEGHAEEKSRFRNLQIRRGANI